MVDDALQTRLQEMIDREAVHVGFVGLDDDFIDWAFAYHSTQTRHQHYLLNHSATPGSSPSQWTPWDAIVRPQHADFTPEPTIEVNRVGGLSRCR